MSQAAEAGRSRSKTSVSKWREPSNRAVVGSGPTGGKDFVAGASGRDTRRILWLLRISGGVMNVDSVLAFPKLFSESLVRGHKGPMRLLPVVRITAASRTGLVANN
jgi:hypothetical protein